MACAEQLIDLQGRHLSKPHSVSCILLDCCHASFEQLLLIASKLLLLPQFLACCIIFCAANVVKALLAKKMASHFHKQTHFQKMRDAIKKVNYTLHDQPLHLHPLRNNNSDSA